MKPTRVAPIEKAPRARISVAAARNIILSMPEAEEHQHQGHPDFRVKNKIFATLWPTENRAVLKIPFAELTIAGKCTPQSVSRMAWGKQEWTNVHLEHIDANTFRELVEDSWYAVAPKVLAARRVTQRRA